MPENIVEKRPNIFRSLFSKVKKGLNFLDQPVNRRDLVLLGMVGLVGLGVKDYLDAEEAVAAQFNPPSLEFAETLSLMQDYDVVLPRDELFGFTFPSTSEMAKWYIDRLQWSYAFGRDYPLVVVQESEPLQFTRKIRQLVGLEPRNRTDNSAAVVIYKTDDSESDYLYLAPGFPSSTPADRASTLYHEGLHLSDPEASFRNQEDRFKPENKAWIGHVLLESHYWGSRLMRTPSIDLMMAYQEAKDLARPSIWWGALFKETQRMH